MKSSIIRRHPNKNEAKRKHILHGNKKFKLFGALLLLCVVLVH